MIITVFCKGAFHRRTFACPTNAAMSTPSGEKWQVCTLPSPSSFKLAICLPVDLFHNFRVQSSDAVAIVVVSLEKEMQLIGPRCPSKCRFLTLPPCASHTVAVPS